MQEECRLWNAQTEATWVKEESKLPKGDFQDLRMELEENPDGEVLTMDEWKHMCTKVDGLEGGMEGSSSAHDESYAFEFLKHFWKPMSIMILLRNLD